MSHTKLSNHNFIFNDFLIKNTKRCVLIYNIFIKRVSFKGKFRIAIYIFKRFVLRQRIPATITLALTYRCQCNCVHCSIAGYPKSKKDEMSTQELKKLINQARKLGIIKITFTGGEPLLRNDVVELVKYAYNLGFCTTIETNGILLTKNLARQLEKAGISAINVSIDSTSSKRHDSLRAYGGCFARAIQGIKESIEGGIPCVVSTYASHEKIKNRELNKIIGLAKNLDASAVRILFPIPCGKWRSSREVLLTDSEKFYVHNLLDPSFVYSENALFDFIKGKVVCSAERLYMLYASSYGKIHVCYAIPKFLAIYEKNH